MNTVIKTNSLNKKYKDTYALKDCSIEIQKGDIYGIVGPNGAGKSTLLKLLSGITEPSSGNIEIFGKTDLNKERSRVSSIVENPTLFGELSAEKNLEYFRIQRGVPDKTVVAKYLKLVGLENTGKKQVKKFSVGMKQRLALALSLITSPEILILDEPTSGIDPAGIVEFRNLLKDLNKEKNLTILISSHILAEISNLANKIAIIDKGEIKKELTLEELYEKSSNIILLKTDNNSKAVNILEEDFGFTKLEVKPKGEIVIYDVDTPVEDIVKSLVMKDIGIQAALKQHQNLEDYYLNITGGNNDKLHSVRTI